MKYLKYLFLVCYIFFTLLIFMKALENGEVSSESSSEVTDVIIEVIDTVTPGEESITDKFDIEDIKFFIRKAIGHFGLFFVLGVFSSLTYFSFIHKKKLSLISITIVGFITASLSEILQGIPGDRYPSVGDVIIDYVGYLLALIMLIFILYVINYIKNKIKGNFK